MPPEVQRTNVDGVETLWADAPGPLEATLTFRVGAVDESLYTRGITTLAARLALQGFDGVTRGLGVSGYLHTTAFNAVGDAAEVLSFLRHVSQTLSRPPMERLEAAREVALVHDRFYHPSVEDGLLSARFGPRGPGLYGYRHLGLHHADADAVSTVIERYFRRENALLTLNKPPPAGLSVAVAGGGTEQPIPRLDPLPLDLPGWCEFGQEDVCVSSLQRVTRGSAYLHGIVAARLNDKLHGSESESVRSGYGPLGHGLVHISIEARAEEPRLAEARDVLIATVDDLAAWGPRTEEVAAVTAARRYRWAGDFDSYSRLLGRKAYLRQLRESDADDPPPGPDDVQEAAGDLSRNALYAVPKRMAMPVTIAAVARSSAHTVEGRTYLPTGDGDSDARLTVGPEGVTLTLRGRRSTVLFRHCEAMEQWEDGVRALYGSDGFALRIDPRLWADGASAVAAVDAGAGGVAIRMLPDPPKVDYLGPERSRGAG
ncbi:MAG TPA: hypothetical protein VHN37_09685 [Actinomycetota bacterium]|nr:hypothetical protein [Actinomycetota bacterium]